MKLRICVTLAGLALASTLMADSPSKEPVRSKLGEKVPNLTFVDAQGQARSLYELKNQKAIALVFVSFECPMSTGYSQLLTDISRDLEKRGGTLVAISVQEDETPATLAEKAKEFRLPFPIYHDAKRAAVAALEAQVTPEAFVLDGSFQVRYRGRIDNAYSERLKKQPTVTRHDLKVALDEVIAGTPVSEPATVAFGCSLVRPARDVISGSEITYHRDVEPILQNRCQTCHRPGDVGPFSLMTYRQAVNWADDIKAYTQKRLMPPWKPQAGLEFHNQRKMTEAEIETLAKWVDAGTPKGDSKDAPAAKQFPEGWQLGQPDLILKPSDEFVLGPSGRDLFRCFVMPSDLPEDVHVTALEIRPSNPRVVHHVLLFIDTTGQGRKLEAKEKKGGDVDVGPGYTVSMGVGFLPQGGLTGWAPGTLARHFPENSGIPVPKKADIIMQVHYHRNGRVERDQTQVGLYFSKKPVEKPYGSGIIAGRGPLALLGPYFVIPAGEENFKLEGNSYAQRDFTLYTVMPHMHMVGKSIKVTMTPPDGAEQVVLDIPQWDYNWQETYFLKDPLAVKAGTHFKVTAIYDNSSKNPQNPFNPPKQVTYGEQTFNEMCFVFLGGTSTNPFPNPRRSLPISPNPPKK